jgi:oligopeptide transport system ATP-binding protein
VFYRSADLAQLSQKQLREHRRHLQIIFQDPYASLNPRMTIGQIDGEPLETFRLAQGREAEQRVQELLETVGLSKRFIKRYPHEFSGGMRQRVMIAMALSCEPELLIADEPTTALDVTIQAQILELIKKLKRETGTSVILITHDLGVVAGMTDHVIVMYAGKIFEQAATSELFARSGNPYTKGLLRSVPDPTAEQGKLYQIPGLPPDVAHLEPGCPFAPRCDRAEEICRREFPPFVQLNADHHSLCHFAREVYSESGGTPA